MTTSQPTRTTRPYLRPAERRRHLLDAAAEVVRRDGLSALTMVAVTAEAKVSRRLVYNHFPDLPTLVRDFAIDRLSSYVQESEPTFEEFQNNPRRLAREIFGRVARIAPEDRQLLRSLLAGAVPRELLPIRAAVEETIVTRWSRILPEGTPLPMDVARLLMLAQIALTLADLMDRGDVTADEASDLIKDAASLVPNSKP